MEQMLLLLRIRRRPRRGGRSLAVLLLQLAVLLRRRMRIRPRVRPPTVGGRLSGGRGVVCGDSPLSAAAAGASSSLAKGRFPRRRHDHPERGQGRL